MVRDAIELDQGFWLVYFCFAYIKLLSIVYFYGIMSNPAVNRTGTKSRAGRLYTSRTPMTHYSNLNTLKRRQTDMGDNTEEVPLSNHSVALELGTGTKAAAYFRDLESPLLRHINEADAVVGCVAWLTNLRVLGALASKRATSIIVQKEDFLRPDLEPLKPNWKTELQAYYEAIRPIPAPGHWMAGWLEVRASEDTIGCGNPLYVVGLRCIGHRKGLESAMPRMHHKFLVFLRERDKSDPEVDGGAWPYQPYAVWTGSYNITKNGNASLENALFIQDDSLAKAYCDEWAQLILVSEPLDWKSQLVGCAEERSASIANDALL